MSRAAVAVVLLEVAAGAAVQASGIGGIYATCAAIAAVIATGGYLITQRHSLPERLRAFAAERRASAPSPGDRSAARSTRWTRSNASCGATVPRSRRRPSA
jgi:hypothetical protein